MQWPGHRLLDNPGGRAGKLGASPARLSGETAFSTRPSTGFTSRRRGEGSRRGLPVISRDAWSAVFTAAFLRSRRCSSAIASASRPSRVRRVASIISGEVMSVM